MRLPTKRRTAGVIGWVGSFVTAAGLSVNIVTRWMNTLPIVVQQLAPFVPVVLASVSVWLFEQQQPRPLIDVTYHSYCDEDEERSWEELHIRNIGDALALSVRLSAADFPDPRRLRLDGEIQSLLPSDQPAVKVVSLDGQLRAAAKKLGTDPRTALTVKLVARYFDKAHAEWSDEFCLTFRYTGLTLKRVKPGERVQWTDLTPQPVA